MPSSARNSSIVIDGLNAFFAGSNSDQIREYSDLGDTVSLASNSPSNLQTRMLGGNDVVTLSDVVTGGFSNRVNGNSGNDTFISVVLSATRDFVAGGSENDTIDLSPSARGGDFINGQRGDDIIIGAPDTELSVLRGGSENDDITVPVGAKCIVVGDLGTDVIRLNSDSRVVLRTDGANTSLIPAEVDTIIGFNSFFDKLYIPGVAAATDLVYTASGADTLLGASAFTNGTSAGSFIAKFNAITPAALRTVVETAGVTTFGAAAETAKAIINPANFLADVNLGNLFA